MVGSIPLGTEAKNGKERGGQRLPSWKCGLALRWRLSKCDEICALKPTSSLLRLRGSVSTPSLLSQKNTEKKEGTPECPQFLRVCLHPFQVCSSCVIDQTLRRRGSPCATATARRWRAGAAIPIQLDPAHPLEGGVIILAGRELHPR